MGIKRGEIYYCDLGNVVGSEQSGVRPVLIIQNDIGNRYSPTVIAIPITSKPKNKLPTHIDIEGTKYGLEKDSVVLTEQVRTLDKSRLMGKVGVLDNLALERVKKGIEVSFGLRGELNFDELIKFILTLLCK